MLNYAITDILLHLDTYLLGFIATYGQWTYALVFLVVFCETGLVITPFLPGDSLLFALGSFAAQPECVLQIGWLLLGLFIAATLGNTVNYQIGRLFGPLAFNQPRRWFFNPEHLKNTQIFYARHGGKALILGRFMPVVRTFVPFVAGIGKMSSFKFMLYNLLSAGTWVGSMLGLGFFFGEIPFVKAHFTWMVLAFLVVPACIPLVLSITFSRKRAKELKEG